VLLHFDGTKLIGYVDETGLGYDAADDREVFTLELDQPAAGQFRFTLLDNLDHHAVADNVENIIGIDFGNLVKVTDTGDTNDEALIADFAINVIDDIPVPFTPEVAMLDNAGVPGGADAQSFELNFANAVGADKDGDVVFNIVSGTPATDANGNDLFLGGEQLFFHLQDSDHKLVAKTADGDVGFTVTLSPGTDSYTVDLEGVIRTGDEFTFSVSANGVSGGNSSGYALTESINLPADGILITATAGGVQDTVNSSSGRLGVGNAQSIGSGEVIRFDFVTGITVDNVAPITQSGFNYGTHREVNSFAQAVAQVQANATTSFSISLFNTDEDSILINDDADDTLVPITAADVKVYTGNPNAGGVLITPGSGIGAGLTITDNGAGVVTLGGMQAGWWYLVESDQTFEAAEIAYAGGNNFDLGNIGLRTLNELEQIDLSLPVLGTDEDGDEVASTIEVTIEPPAPPPNANPTATDDSFTVSESGVQAALIASPVLLGNVITGGTPDSDPNGDALSVTGITNWQLNETDLEVDVMSVTPLGSNQFRVTTTDGVALVQVAANGSVTMWSQSGDAFKGLGVGQTCSITFTYAISDGNGGTASAQGTITITGTNDAPVANSYAVTINEDSGISAGAPGAMVVSRDDGGFANMTAILVSGPQHAASFTLNADGSYSYTPVANFSGTDSFTFRIQDAQGLQSNVATYTINVTPLNDAPVANNDTIYVSDDTVVTLPWSTFLANDTDADLDTLSITAVSSLTGISGGSIPVTIDSVNKTVSFTMPPLGGDDAADNSFTYTISDGNGGTSVGTVNVVAIDTLSDTGGPTQAAVNYSIPAGAYAGSYLDGHAGNDVLTGGSANDILLVGGAGDDTLVGGAGSDTLTGGSGADQFRLTTTGGAGNVKKITDYTDNTDKIGLLDTGATGSGSVNFSNTVGSAAGTTLNAADFISRATVSAIGNGDDNKVILITSAQSTATITGTTISGGGSPDNNYILVFNSTTGRGEIWFDTNWENVENRVQIATLDNITTLGQLTAITASDIVVYNSATDPIVLDLDGNGIGFSALDDGVSFDLDADGTKDKVAWNSSGDGILAYDLNGNGVIDDGSELFTPKFNGGNFANGSAALASLDSNGDGVIDANDAAFGNLSIWQDLNGDGVTDAGELKSLAEHGIASLSASTTPASSTIDGQAVVGEGSFTRTDGTTGSYVEVELDTIPGGGEAQEPETFLVGDDGDDVLFGEAGVSDTLVGGAGADTFVLTDLTAADFIADFSFEEGDAVDLTALFSTGGGDVADYVSYDKTTGELKVDADGAGGADAVTVATITNLPTALTIIFDDGTGGSGTDTI
jgi:VCBS repeat-containing protein